MPNDLDWWDQIAKPPPPHPIPFPVNIHDVQAYSDARSSRGIRIVIRDRWRAWVLDKSWQTDGRDISWAEAIRFELLAHTVTEIHPNLKHFQIYSNNTGVIEGWWNGQSRNPATNEVFQRIHLLEAELGVTFYMQYVASVLNPADNPSRGIYPPQQLLLPPVCNHHSVVHLILDFDHSSLVLSSMDSRRDHNQPKLINQNKRQKPFHLPDELQHNICESHWSFETHKGASEYGDFSIDNDGNVISTNTDDLR